MSTSDNCKDDASTKSNNDVCDVKDKLQNMSTGAAVSICANCGKEGDDVNNKCNKCKQVRYCNAACKKKHRHKHKKECERFLAEQHDEELFKQPPAADDCPICEYRLPMLVNGWRYMSCCGKVICSGCIHAPLYDNQGNKVDNKNVLFVELRLLKQKKKQGKRKRKELRLMTPLQYTITDATINMGTTGFHKIVPRC